MDIYHNNSGIAQQRCYQYPKGAEVTVYYNPRIPQEACLERRTETSTHTRWMAIGFAEVGYLTIDGLFD